MNEQFPEVTASVPVKVTMAFNQIALEDVVLNRSVFCPEEIFGITL